MARKRLPSAGANPGRAPTGPLQTRREPQNHGHRVVKQIWSHDANAAPSLVAEAFESTEVMLELSGAGAVVFTLVLGKHLPLRPRQVRRG